MPSATVSLKELDQTAASPSFPGLYIGMVLADAVKGPTNVALLNSSETQFLNRYTKDGTVSSGYSSGYFSALVVLAKSNKLWTVRPSTSGLIYCGAIINVPSTANTTLASTTGPINPDSVTMTAESFRIWGNTPGSYSSDLRIAIWNYKTSETFTASTSDNTLTTAQNWGVGFPVRVSTTGVLPAPLDASVTYYTTASAAGKVTLATSQANASANTVITLTTIGSGVNTIKPALDLVKSPNMFTIQVFKSANLNSPLETFICSKDRNAKLGNGTSAYIETVTLGSNYIYITDNVLVTGSYVNDQIIPLPLGGGADGSAATDSDCIRALSALSNTESVPVTVLIDAGRNTVAYQQALVSTCESRQDCVAILSVPYTVENAADYLTSIDNYVNGQLNVNSSYAAIYSSNVLMYDKYNDRQIYLAPDAYVAALISQASVNYEMWYPVAGSKRGTINVLDVHIRFTKTDMDYLVDRNINTIRYAQGKGIAIWSQRTLNRTQNATSRLNVRLALIGLEPLLVADLEPYLQDLNDDDVRSLARIALNGTFKNFQSRKGIGSYQLNITKLSDETNPYTMTVKGYIVPMYAVEQIPITLSLVNGNVTLTAG
jgi:phage tail sheath protein FI